MAETKECTACTKQFEGIRTVCDACRKRAQRNSGDKVLQENVPTDIQSGFRAAVKCQKDTPGAVWRRVTVGPDRPGHWVIPGVCPSAFDGSPTSCLNPGCKN